MTAKGAQVALAVCSVVLVVTGVFLLWIAASGRGTEWSNTHDRWGSRQAATRVTVGQRRFNRIAGLVGGLITIAAGVVALVLALTAR